MKVEKVKKDILVVDDDIHVLKTLKTFVTSFGYSCVVASDGVEAVEILMNTQCELVLSDVLMPNMDGLELLEYIRKNHVETDVIIATGYSDRASYADVIKAGAIDFVKKPIDRDELEAKLARAFRERQLVRNLEQLSMVDSLTSVYNRRAFDSKFPKEVDRAFRQNYSLFLAIIDIDNFKVYNDKYGHSDGDKVLIATGRILQECTRNNVDLTFRLGGDEFAALLPQTSADQATEIVQRILLRFVEYGFDGTTLSIGIISCKRDGSVTLEEDGERMKNRADKAMYEAKNSGKNCVVFRL